jgi:hypothetical protein
VVDYNTYAVQTKEKDPKILEGELNTEPNTSTKNNSDCASPPWCLSVDPALPFSPFTDLPLPSY